MCMPAVHQFQPSGFWGRRILDESYLERLCGKTVQVCASCFTEAFLFIHNVFSSPGLYVSSLTSAMPLSTLKWRKSTLCSILHASGTILMSKMTSRVDSLEELQACNWSRGVPRDWTFSSICKSRFACVSLTDITSTTTVYWHLPCLSAL